MNCEQNIIIDELDFRLFKKNNSNDLDIINYNNIIIIPDTLNSSSEKKSIILKTNPITSKKFSIIMKEYYKSYVIQFNDILINTIALKFNYPDQIKIIDDKTVDRIFFENSNSLLNSIKRIESVSKKYSYPLNLFKYEFFLKLFSFDTPIQFITPPPI